MRKILTLTTIGVLMFSATQSFAQAADAPAAPQAGKVAPILKQIPGGGMCFFVINDIKAFTDSIDQFLVAAGLGELAKNEMPEGVLKEMIGKMEIQPGFNPAGGLGFVMLDPTQYGADLVDFLPPPIGTGKGNADWKPPFIVFLPGTGGVKAIFGADKVKDDPENKTGFEKFDLGMGPLYAAQMGDYLAISPTDKALTAIAASGQKKAIDEISKSELAAIEKAGFAVNINMKVCGSLVDKILTNLNTVTSVQPDGSLPESDFDKESVLAIKSLYSCKSMISQLSSVTLAITVGQTGLQINPVIDFKADSKFGVALAAFKALDKLPIGRVPNLNCGIGFGTTVIDPKLLAEMDVDGVNALADILMAASTWNMPKDFRKMMIKTVQAMDLQTTGVQFAFGASDEGSGAFGAAMLVECEDSAKYKESIDQLVSMANEIFANMIQDADFKDLKLSYVKNAETIEEVKVDTIEILHPKFDPAVLKADDVTKMKNLFGTDKLRVIIAPVDGKTVLLTFGGDKAYMAQAIKAAKKGGNFDATFASVAKDLPAQLNCVGMIDVANMMSVAKSISTAMSEPFGAPMEMKPGTPIIIGVGSNGTSLNGKVIVPVEVIKTFFMGIMVSAPAQPVAPVAVPE